MKIRLIALLLVFCLVFTVACAETTCVGVLIGPTGMGTAHMMTENDGRYEFVLRGAPEDISAGLISGSLDIAAVPTNMASVLFNKTNGGVKLLALNTLGVLYVLEKGDTIHSTKDLSGKRIVTSGQGAMPEYVLSYVLEKNGVTDAQIEWRSEHSEVTAMGASGMTDIVLLPEPQVTALLTKAPEFRIALDMTEEFAAASDNGAVLSMGCFVVRTEYLEKHQEEVLQFMADAEQSIAYANENIDAAAAEIELNGILPSAAVAKKAIPNSHMVFVAGQEMKNQVMPMFDILYASDPKAVGGRLPDETIYFIP